MAQTAKIKKILIQLQDEEEREMQKEEEDKSNVKKLQVTSSYLLYMYITYDV